MKYDLNGWLGVVGGPLEYIENSIKSIREQASQVNKNPDKFQIIIYAAPNVKSSSRDENRFPFSGSIDEIGSDILRYGSRSYSICLQLSPNRKKYEWDD
jgi:hypothetical protein